MGFGENIIGLPFVRTSAASRTSHAAHQPSQANANKADGASPFTLLLASVAPKTHKADTRDSQDDKQADDKAAQSSANKSSANQSSANKSSAGDAADVAKAQSKDVASKDTKDVAKPDAGKDDAAQAAAPDAAPTDIASQQAMTAPPPAAIALAASTAPAEDGAAGIEATGANAPAAKTQDAKAQDAGSAAPAEQAGPSDASTAQANGAQATPGKTTAKPDARAAKADAAKSSDAKPADAKPAGPQPAAADQPAADKTAQPHADAATTMATGVITAPQSQQAAAASAPVLTQHVQVTAQPAPNLPALAVEIAAKSQGGAKQFDIRLDPPELGRVEVRLSIDAAGKASAHLTADQPQTLDLLQKDSTNLTRALRDAGLDVSQNGLNFSLRQQTQDSGAGRNGGRSQSRGVMLTAVKSIDATQASAVYRAPADGRLDIKV